MLHLLIWNSDVCERYDRPFTYLLEVLERNFLLITAHHLYHFPHLLFCIRLLNVLQEEYDVFLSYDLIFVYIDDFEGFNDFLFTKRRLAYLVPGNVLSQRNLFSLNARLVLLLLVQLKFIVYRFLACNFNRISDLPCVFIRNELSLFHFDLILRNILFGFSLFENACK